MFNYNLVQNIAIWTIPVLSAIVIHEVAHGYIAKLLGDNTAYFMGRLTLNPFKHIDPFGTIILPLLCIISNTMVLGWAKPVPVNYKYLKNYKVDPMLVAIAGPGANLIMAIIWALLTKLCMLFANTANYDIQKTFFINMGFAGIYFNIFLMLVNLIPVPPLDGSKIIGSLLPSKAAILYNSIENYGFIILIVLMYSKIIPKILEEPLMLIVKLLINIFNL